LVLVASGAALRSRETEAALANPIRKVVTMLQSMQTKVQEEGEKEQALYDKYMCYCKTAGGDLQESIAKAGSSISELGTKIKAAEEQKVVLGEELKTAQSDRTAAKAAMAEATAVREKEAAAYAAEKADDDKDIAAVAKAIKAISTGMAGSFLQTTGAQMLKQILLGKRDDLMDDERQDVLAFLSGMQESPQSGQIVGILKQMADEMKKGAAEAAAAEEGAIKIYYGFMAAKKKRGACFDERNRNKVGESGDARSRDCPDEKRPW